MECSCERSAWDNLPTRDKSLSKHDKSKGEKTNELRFGKMRINSQFVLVTLYSEENSNKRHFCNNVCRYSL